MDTDELWRELRNGKQRRKAATGWTQHTPHHWSRQLHGKQLNYWPSVNKFQYDGRVYQGDVNAFIASQTHE